MYANGQILESEGDVYRIYTPGIYRITARDSFGNETELTVTVKGKHSYEKGNPSSEIWRWNGNREASLTLVCTVCGHECRPTVSVNMTERDGYTEYTASAIGDDNRTYTDTIRVEKAASPPTQPSQSPQPTQTPQPTPIPEIKLAPEPTPVWEDELWFDGEYYGEQGEIEAIYTDGAAGTVSSPEPSASPEPGSEQEKLPLSRPPKGNLIIRTEKTETEEKRAQNTGTDGDIREANRYAWKALGIAYAACAVLITLFLLSLRKKRENIGKND